MAKELNATCHLCGKKYHRCDECDKLNHVFASWKGLAESEEHFKIFNILVSYGLKKISKEDAAKQLKQFDLSDVDSWEDEDNKAIIKSILTVEEKKERVSAKKTEAKK